MNFVIGISIIMFKIKDIGRHLSNALRTLISVWCSLGISIFIQVQIFLITLSEVRCIISLAPTHVLKFVIGYDCLFFWSLISVVRCNCIIMII